MNILLNIDTRSKKKDGTYPILLRISASSGSLPISTGYAVPKQYWDDGKREIKKGYNGYKSISRINNLLNSKKNEASAVVTELEEKGLLSALTLKEVKARIISVFRKPEALAVIEVLRAENVIASDKMKEQIVAYLDNLVQTGGLAIIAVRNYKAHFKAQLKTGLVSNFIKEIEADLRERKKPGNADVYKDLGGVLRNFCGEQIHELTFNNIDLTFLNRLEKWHLQKGLKINGLSVYLRTLRSTYNKAASAGIADKDGNPFADYKIRTEPTAKRAISTEYLQRIMALELEPDHELFDARNYFVASFTMQGMSYVDMAFLKMSDIIDGRIKYRRKKSSRNYNLPYSPMLKGILEHYYQNNRGSAYIFPIIKRTDLEDQYKDIRWSRKRYNAKLKLIAQKCDIEENLTSYVSRHSFAMSARLAKIPIDAISQMLGHRDVKTTEIYLDSIPNTHMDDYMDQVIKVSF